MLSRADTRTGAELRDGAAVAVVTTPGDDNPGASGAGIGNSQRQLVRLGAGTAESRHRQRIVKRSRQLFRVIEDVLMQVTGVVFSVFNLPDQASTTCG